MKKTHGWEAVSGDEVISAVEDFFEDQDESLYTMGIQALQHRCRWWKKCVWTGGQLMLKNMPHFGQIQPLHHSQPMNFSAWPRMHCTEGHWQFGHKSGVSCSLWCRGENKIAPSRGLQTLNQRNISSKTNKTCTWIKDGMCGSARNISIEADLACGCDKIAWYRTEKIHRKQFLPSSIKRVFTWKNFLFI